MNLCNSSRMCQILRVNSLFIALFNNMWNMKFKSSPTVAFFAAVNQHSGSIRRQRNSVSLAESKGHVLHYDWWISIQLLANKQIFKL